MTVILIGIDDTDNLTSPGTGHLARMLAGELGARGLRTLGITRHQFLLDDRIPYTSHNSGACVAAEGEKTDLPAAAELALAFVAGQAAEGSDPGVCVAMARAVGPLTVALGWAATREVLTMQQATDAAAAEGILLRPLGGSGQGIIGALASVGLRADGNEGRFIDMPGLRELPERVEPARLEEMGIRVERCGPVPAGTAGGADPADSAGWTIQTLGWVRPRLVEGRALLPVEWSEVNRAWIPVDRRKSRPLE